MIAEYDRFEYDDRNSYPNCELCSGDDPVDECNVCGRQVCADPDCSVVNRQTYRVCTRTRCLASSGMIQHPSEVAA